MGPVAKLKDLLRSDVRDMHPATRVVLKAVGIFGGVKFLSVLCSLLRNKLIAVCIGPAGVGLVILYNSVIELIASVTRLNMDQSAMRDIAAAAHGDIDRTATVVSAWSVALGMLGALLMCVFSPLLSYWSFGDCGHWWAYCVLGVVPLCYSISNGQQAIMQGVGAYARLARVGLWTALAGLAVAVPLIISLGEASIVWIIAAYAVTMLAVSTMTRVRFRHIAMGLRGIVRQGLSFIRLGAWITVGLSVMPLANYLFVIYFNSATSTGDLGVYQAGFTIVNTYVGMIFSGVWVEYYPHLTAVAHAPRRVSTVISHRVYTLLWMCLPVVTLFMALATVMVCVVYSSDFLGMMPYILPAIAALPLRVVAWSMSMAIMARGDGPVYALTEVLSGVVFLVTATVGYGLGGYLGLGIAYFVWHIIYLATVWVTVRRLYGYRISDSSARFVIAATTFAALACVLRMWLGWLPTALMSVAMVPLALHYLFKNPHGSRHGRANEVV